MENGLVFSQERTVSSAFIDSSVKMGAAQAVMMIQDNITECFSKMECDGVTCREKYNAFWIFMKTRLDFTRRPDWREKVVVDTFPVDNIGLKTHVDTVFRDKSGEIIIKAELEACVLDISTHRPVRLESVHYPTENFPESVFDEPFDRFDIDFSEEDFSFEQTVRSHHIDMSHHMNNTEYIKLALDTFTDDFLLSHEVKSMEVHYKGESREGETLRVYRKTSDNGTFVVIKERDRTVFEMKIVF